MSGRAATGCTTPARGQHYLADRRLAAELASAADLTADDLVVEPGAGFGRLTGELAARAGRVVAIEADPRAAARLASRFGDHARVSVVAGDALRVPLPRRPFKVVANPPFHLTAGLLHRLLDECLPQLQRADLVLEWRAAVGLCAVSPPSRRSLPWQPWFEFLLARRLAADRFVPAPGCDAALVSIRRRRRPLLPERDAGAFRRFARRQPAGDIWEVADRFRRHSGGGN
ncbi:MAG: rRNA adenine N(6)-methyltransferase family protein [Candidatus Dormibacteraeota bacterium]|nr:rRNA adenine N(6)-methyltransferase family protein [Candidatus Dormibacteraeota bacterium]